MALTIVAGSAVAATPAKKSGASSGAIGAPGTIEFGLKGLLSLNRGDDTAVYARLTLGYYVMNGLELGMTALVGTTPAGERDTFGLFGEYDFATFGALTCFGGGGLKHTAPPRGTGDDGRIVYADAGLNLAIAANVALGLSLVSSFADHAVLGVAGDRTRRDQNLDLNLRIYF